MTNQRRRELIEWLEQFRQDSVSRAEYVSACCARDLLSVLRNDALPWRVWNKYSGELIGAFTKHPIQHFNLFVSDPIATITGPDDSPAKCPDCHGTGRDNVPYGERCDTCCPPKSHSNTTQFDGIPENVVY